MAGAGLSLALIGDIVVAAETARFTSAYTGVGLCPDGSLTFKLPRIVGEKRALEMILTNRVLSAREALEWGLVTKIVPVGELTREGLAIATTLASGPTLAFGASRRLVGDSFSSTLETQMEMESRSLANMTRTSDSKAAIEAFIKKRKPIYQGK